MMGGVARMLFPTASAGIVAGFGQNTGMIIATAVVVLLLGTAFVAFWP